MLTQERLKEIVHYSKKSGVFTRLISAKGGTKSNVGDNIGTKTNSGYLYARVEGRAYALHVLAFLYVDGYFPEHIVEHKDGIRHNNKWDNIRHATQVCNMQNSTMYINNKSGFKGVYKHGNKYQAVIIINKERIFLGTHEDKLKAAVARLEYEIECPEWHCDLRQVSVKLVLQALKDAGKKKLAKKLKKRLRHAQKET